MTNILSNNIKVFPSVKRSDEYDLAARLPSEYNLTNIINRLTGKDSFIITGLDVSVENNKPQINVGECNIKGYYFNITSPIMLNDIGNNTKIYLYIEVEERDSFTELKGNDTGTTNSEYSGLKISYTEPTVGYYLLLATKDNITGTWINNTQASIRYTSEMLEIPTTKKDTQEIYNVWELFSNPTNQSDLRLNNLIMNLGNLIIDDGDLDQQ